MLDVTAAVLVGGLGTRLRTVVADRPKPLADVAGRPFVLHVLDQLAAAGVPRSVLLAGYMGERVKEVLGDHHGQMALAYAFESEPLGTAGALGQASSLLDTAVVLLANGDSYVDVNLAGLLAAQRAGRDGARATMVVVEVPDAGRYGRVELDDAGRIRAFHEKSADTGPGWINAGMVALDADLVRAIRAAPGSLERDYYPRWAAAGLLHAFQTRGRFIDIGTPQTYAESQEFFRP